MAQHLREGSVISISSITYTVTNITDAYIEYVDSGGVVYVRSWSSFTGAFVVVTD